MNLYAFTVISRLIEYQKDSPAGVDSFLEQAYTPAKLRSVPKPDSACRLFTCSS